MVAKNSAGPSGTLDLGSIRVADLMHPGVVFCERDAGVTEIARLMSTCRVHVVVVMGVSPDHRKPLVWGVISDLDLLDALAGIGGPATAGELAHTPAVQIRPNRSALEAAEAMCRDRVQHLIVADPEVYEPLGVISTLDIATALAGGNRAPST